MTNDEFNLEQERRYARARSMAWEAVEKISSACVGSGEPDAEDLLAATHALTMACGTVALAAEYQREHDKAQDRRPA